MRFPLYLSLLALAASQLSAQTGKLVFDFISMDSSSEGFGDPTPLSEIPSELIGDNPGTTLGELRRNVLDQAGARWSKFLLSDVPIEVEVDFSNLGGSTNGSISLAGASSLASIQNFSNAPLPNILYPIALANSLAGVDLSSNADIRVTVNSNSELSGLGTTGFRFYFGFDNNAPAGTLDFLNIISHELGHGLGFASNFNGFTGNFTGSGTPNVYAANVFDVSLGLTWPQMTPAQRLTSSVSQTSLTWNGPNVTGAIDGIESFVTRGLAVSGTTSFPALPATFGGNLSAAGLEGSLVLVNDGVGEELNNGAGSTADLAQEIINGAEVAGNIALIVRGLVSFDVKVRAAEDAGAVAAVIFNNADGDILVSPSASGTVQAPTIPVIFVSENTGAILRDFIAEDLPVTLNSTLISLSNDEATPERSRLRLFAPATFSSGSSVSHWSTDASPNLLMEPSINSNVTADLDLSVLLMKDIGWQTQDIIIPHLTYDLWLIDSGLADQSTDQAENDDFDNDGLTNLEEYYHGTDPLSATMAQLTLSGNQLTHQRALTPNDLFLDYQSSDQLNNFISFEADETINIADSLEDASVEIQFTEARQFFRLLITPLDPSAP